MTMALLLAAAVTVSVTPSKTDVSVGETFTVQLKAQAPAGTELIFPMELQDEKIELRAEPEARPQPGTQTYRAAVFGLTDVTIPALNVSYKLPDGQSGKVQTEPVALHVRSLLPRDPKEQQLVDIRPPVSVSIGRAFYVTVGVLLVAFAGLAYWLWRRRRPAPVAKAVAPPPPPDVLARAALDRLAASGLLQREEYRPFYIQLTDIAKRYLEARLEAPILEMTTAEMVAFLRRNGPKTDISDMMRDVSGAADQIKFARGRGAQEMAERHLLAVRQMITAIEAERRPALAEPDPMKSSSGAPR
jgi:hypothetical protein